MTYIHITYGEYITLPEEKQQDYVFLMDYGKFNGEKLVKANYMSDKPLQDYSWEFVKTLMRMYGGGDIYGCVEYLFEHAGWGDYMQTEAWKVILSVRMVLDEIEKLIRIENNSLTSQFFAEHLMQMEQVDFSMFDQEYFQLNDLAGGDITKFEMIKNLQYKAAFVQLLYIFKNNEFEKAVMKSTTKS